MKELSPIELEVLMLGADGLINQRIGEVLCLSKRTIDKHKENLIKKLNAENFPHAVAIAFRNNIID